MNTMKRKNVLSILIRGVFTNKLVCAVTIIGILMFGTAFATLTMQTKWHSEENQPAMCPNDMVMFRIECSGKYCDNVSASCEEPQKQLGYNYDDFSYDFGNYTYTNYKSDEHGFNECYNGYYVTGIDCKGSYCDNQSLQCTKIYNTKHDNCEWLGPFSEEKPNNFQICPPLKYITGIYCYDKYCDKKYIKCCSMSDM